MSISRSLLILPAPPSPITPESISAAYRPSINATVNAVKSLPTITQLYVILPLPSLSGRLHEARSHIYEEVQELVGKLYSLICLECAKLGADVDVDIPGSIDARIMLLDPALMDDSSVEHISNNTVNVLGPIVNLAAFSLSRRNWDFIFSVEGENGQKLLASYLMLANSVSPPLQAQMRTVSGGLSMVQSTPSRRQNPAYSNQHTVVAVGGTFDHIHAGHKLLLTATSLLLQPTSLPSATMRRLIVGITGDQLLKNKKYAEYLKSWKQRQDDVVDFLLSILSFTPSTHEDIKTASFDEPIPNGRAIHTSLNSNFLTIECVEIQDPFGPTITDESITALVVSGETRSGGRAVNEKRIEHGWHPLEVFEVDVLDAQESTKDDPTKTESFASKISSTETRKRKAEIARTSSL